MTLATVTADGRPAARMVICRGFDVKEGWLVFYTDRESDKGLELLAHPQAALVFHWDGLERQIRIDGPVSPAPRGQVDAYWATRPVDARIAAIADTSGLEYVGVQDHPYNSGFVDTLTQITWLAAHTSSVHFFPNVADLPLRPPAMLAKQAATIDVFSGGRFELGLGAGAFGDGIVGMGGPRRTVGEARQALSEAIDIIRRLWRGDTAGVTGEVFSLAPGARLAVRSVTVPRSPGRRAA